MVKLVIFVMTLTDSSRSLISPPLFLLSSGPPWLLSPAALQATPTISPPSALPPSHPTTPPCDSRRDKIAPAGATEAAACRPPAAKGSRLWA